MKGVRGLLASVKDVFTPIRKWNREKRNLNARYIEIRKNRLFGGNFLKILCDKFLQ